MPGRIQTLRLEADEPGIYAGQCAEFCGLSHANMRMEIVALSAEDFETWKANQLADYEAPEEGTQAAEGEAVFIQQCARCHQVNGLVDERRRAGDRPSRGPGVRRRGAQPHAPDVAQHVRRGDVRPAHPRSAARWCGTRRRRTSAPATSKASPRECLNAADLREWIRNAPEKKPMYTDPEELGPTGGLPRGMPYLGLSEDQIDDLIAYLLELN